MIAKTTPGIAYCNCLAQQRGLDPVGHAGGFDDATVVEVPLPWKHNMTQQAGTLPQPIIDLLALWLRRYYAGEGYPHYLLAVAPDPAYSREGFRRVMFYSHPAGLFARFEKVEYQVPVDEVGSLVWSWYEARENLPRFDAYHMSEADAARDILVCTHGTVDAACAKFGYPLYRHMRDTYTSDRLRVWRVSHFGGHVFAPTLMDMPAGHYWAYVEETQAAQIIRRDGDVATLRGHYRGWAGVGEGFLQAAECALWQQHGWQWLAYRKSGDVIAQNDGEKLEWADIRFRYRAPDSSAETVVEMRVEVTHTIETPLSTGKEDMYPYPQYKVVSPLIMSGRVRVGEPL